MDLLQEQKGAGAGCPNMPTVLLLGKKTRLANRTFFRGLGGKRVYEVWKNGQATQQGYRAAV